jgi:hypothetical protein
LKIKKRKEQVVKAEWEWECPDCFHVNPRSEEDFKLRGWVGTQRCANCKRIYELLHIYQHGFARLAEEKERP